MRRADSGAPALTPAQAAVAATGNKGMIPAGPAGRPFLDYLLSALADAGVDDVVLVVPPEHAAVRRHYAEVAPPRRVRLRYAVQPEAVGTANAVACAAAVIGARPFLVHNADNRYPVEALRALAHAPEAATVAFDRDALVAGGIPAERVRAFAVLDVDDAGRLRAIVEKPGAALDLASPAARWVGMNCWTVTPPVVDACRRVPRSVRGEYELPEAVALLLREGGTVRAFPCALPVLDLSQQGDIPAVAAQLAALVPDP
ncbi:MAG: NTP transferase domain-containing protein [Gemmatimonadetes bacterium]|nr:NTP transferase domain-containing protein [Gemmatimonadota bacterium]